MQNIVLRNLNVAELCRLILLAAADRCSAAGITTFSVKHRPDHTDIEIYASDGVYEVTGWVDCLTGEPCWAPEYVEGLFGAVVTRSPAARHHAASSG